MARHWFIDSRARLIVVTAEGSVSAKHWLDNLAVPAA
jgi:hypothetical protein